MKLSKTKNWCRVIIAVVCGCAIIGGVSLNGRLSHAGTFGTAGESEECPFDYDGDSDVDGADLAEFVVRPDGAEAIPEYVGLFAADFGSTECRTCRDFLPCDIIDANDCFRLALSIDPTDLNANFFYSVTRLLVLAHNPTFNGLLDQLDVSETGRTFCNTTADFERDAEGDIILPNELPPSGDALALLTDVLLPEINAALDNLSEIDETFQLILCKELQLPDDIYPCEDIEVDYGDVAMYRSALYAAKAVILIADAYDLNVNETAQIVAELENDLFSINTYLCSTGGDSSCLPGFLTLKNDHALDDARVAVQCAIDSYMEASVFIRAETDDQLDDFITIASEEEADEEAFSNLLLDIECALNEPGETLIGDEELHDPFDLDLTEFFDNPKGLRQFVPSFHGDDEITCGSFPDPTFGGILPGFDQDRLANLLGLEILLSGEVTCSHSGSGDIFVGDCLWYGNVYNSCSADDFTVIFSPGSYGLMEEAGEEVEISAFWDRDGDDILSPGDYFGAYPSNPIFLVSDNCSGPSDVDIELSEQMIGIEGRITSDGIGVGGVQVSISSERCWAGTHLGGAVTDPNGYYVINDLPQAAVYVEVHMWPRQYIGGWWNGSGGVTGDCGATISVVPSAGSTTVNIDLELADSISGYVWDWLGNPISWASIEAYEYDTGSWLESASSREDGSYTLYIGRADIDAFIVKAEVWSGNFLGEYYDDKYDRENADPIDLTEGVDHITGINFQLAQGGQIVGNVTDTNGDPIQWPSVVAYDYDTKAYVKGANSYMDGSFSIGGLPTGTYIVRIYETDQNCGGFYDGKSMWDDADPVSVTAGSITENIDFELCIK